jgi:uncharacterized glyoxalase superfamily protein PhnB
MSQVLVPYFGYRDAPRAIDFLMAALGFAIAARFDAEDGRVIHAELEVDGARIMLGTAAPDHVLPDPRSRAAAFGTYLVVADVDGRFRRATAAGAAVVYGPEATELGTRYCRIRDPEGYEWSLGSYRPGTS